MQEITTTPLSSNTIDQNQLPRNFTDKFVIRLPRGLRESIAHIAKNNRRSMNSEIVMLIEEEVSKNHSNTPTKSTPAKKNEITEHNLNRKEAIIIKNFRKLSTSKQQAILALIS